MSVSISRPGSPAVPLGVIIAAAVLALPFLIDPLARARFLNHVLIIWGMPLLIIAAAAGIALMLAVRDRAGAATAVLVLGFLVLTGFTTVRGYQAHVYYNSTVEETADPLPDFADRAPQQVAAKQATSSLSGINGTPERTAYLPADDRYTTLVAKPGPLNPGYAALVSQEIALTGQAKGDTCRFTGQADRRLDGFFGHSLPRAVAGEDARLMVNKADAYGYCYGDTPFVVVPVTRLEGFLVPVHVPAGAVLYNGDTGQVSIADADEAAELPGGSIGISYSERVNASMRTWDGSWWSSLIKQTGLTDELKDSEDTNTLNATNFALDTGDGPAFATPLTYRAASVTIDAVLVMESNAAPGEVPRAVMHKLAVPRSSNAATADRIKADFPSLSWASGLFIQEIVPAADGEWSASIGLNQNVTHRVLVKDDGSSCLQDARGNVITCSGDEPEDNAGTGPAATVPGDISGLSDAELQQLLKSVTDEVFNRLAKEPAA